MIVSLRRLLALPLLLVLLLAATAGPAQAQTVIYVDNANSSSTKDGDSWATAYTSLHDALSDSDATGASATNTQIWIADGIYTPTDDPDIATTNRDTSFYVSGKQDGLAIYGGFTGKGEDEETSLSERDVDGNPPVVLSGDIDGNDTVNGQGVTEEYSDVTCCNSHHVLIFDGGYGGGRLGDVGIGARTDEDVTSATVLDGVTVTAGQTAQNTDVHPGDANGGGLYCDGAGFTTSTASKGGGCSPTIRDVVFQGNSANGQGGAVYVNGSSNINAEVGGGFSVIGESSPSFTDVVFRGNGAETGGALYINANSGKSESTITDVLFVENVATDFWGGAIVNQGTEGRASPRITDAVFRNNRSSKTGAAIRVTTSEGTFEDFEDTRPEIKNSVFIGNSVDVDFNSGAVVSFKGDGTLGGVITNSVFANSDTYHVGFWDGGGPVSPRLVNCTFTGADSRILEVREFADLSGATPIEFVNSIFSGNGGDMAGTEADQRVSDPDAAVDVRYSLVEEASYAEGGANGGTGNIDGTDPANDPQFADASDPAGSDGDFGTLDDGLRLQGSGSGGGASPAIDAGDNSALPSGLSADLAERSRRQDVSGVSDTGNGSAPIVDMGAYESSGNPLPVEMAAFDATMDEKTARLTWRTATEQNNAGFTVQRKPASRDDAWTKVGYVESNASGGTTTEPQSYQFTDGDLPYEADRLTYRLKQVDTDGTTSFSKEVTIKRGAVTELQLQGTHPNPVRTEATVQYAVPERSAGEATLRLYDVLGRRVRTLVSGKQEGRQKRTLDVSDLSSGVYFLRLRAGGTVKTRRMTVVR